MLAAYVASITNVNDCWQTSEIYPVKSELTPQLLEYPARRYGRVTS